VNRLLPLADAQAVILKPIAAASFAGLLLSTAGAFDTEAARFGPRLLYWLAISGISMLALQGMHKLLRRCFDAVPDVWLRASGWLVLTLPLDAVAALACKLLFGGTPSLAGFLLLLPGMAAILAALQLLLSAFQSAPPQTELTSSAIHSPPSPHRAGPFAAFLPLPLQYSPIQALQAEDHYVRVYTRDGQALIRMRMRDAVAMLAEEDGVRPHRSWWVARAAIVSLRREGNRTLIQLADGTSVPVSRSVRHSLGPPFEASGAGAPDVTGPSEPGSKPAP
jgi:hypothetical protein